VPGARNPCHWVAVRERDECRISLDLIAWTAIPAMTLSWLYGDEVESEYDHIEAGWLIYCSTHISTIRSAKGQRPPKTQLPRCCNSTRRVCKLDSWICVL
jgi:hypothetical protein